MDEDAKEVVKVVAGVALRPAVDVIDDVIGVLGGDALAEFRQRQKEKRQHRHQRLSDDAIRLLQDRGVKEAVEPNAAAVDELAEAAQNEPREELQKLWAQLLAAMFDPARAPSFRREFIAIAKQLEPLDAAVLPLLNAPEDLTPSRLEFVASRLSAKPVDVELAVRTLARLELVWPDQSRLTHARQQPHTTALGKQILAAIA